jgi:hypothetical protein
MEVARECRNPSGGAGVTGVGVGVVATGKSLGVHDSEPGIDLKRLFQIFVGDIMYPLITSDDPSVPWGNRRKVFQPVRTRGKRYRRRSLAG